MSYHTILHHIPYYTTSYHTILYYTSPYNSTPYVLTELSARRDTGCPRDTKGFLQPSTLTAQIQNVLYRERTEQKM